MGFYRSEDEEKKLISVNFYLYFLFLTNIKVTVLLSVRFQDYDKFKKPKEMPDRPGKSETGQHCGYRPDVPTGWSAKSQGGQMKEEL